MDKHGIVIVCALWAEWARTSVKVVCYGVQSHPNGSESCIKVGQGISGIVCITYEILPMQKYISFFGGNTWVQYDRSSVKGALRREVSFSSIKIVGNCIWRYPDRCHFGRSICAIYRARLVYGSGYMIWPTAEGVAVFCRLSGVNVYTVAIVCALWAEWARAAVKVVCYGVLRDGVPYSCHGSVLSYCVSITCCVGWARYRIAPTSEGIAVFCRLAGVNVYTVSIVCALWAEWARASVKVVCYGVLLYYKLKAVGIYSVFDIHCCCNSNKACVCCGVKRCEHSVFVYGCFSSIAWRPDHSRFSWGLYIIFIFIPRNYIGS